jgi:Family of unknown function (DUF5989)
MAEQKIPTDERGEGRLADLADQRATSIVSELFGFMSSSRKWWLMPILLSLMLVGLFLFLATTGAAPLIYTLF